MVDYGITPEGFNRKPQDVILAEIEAAEIGEIDPLLDVSPDQPLGQLNGIQSRLFSELWELAEVAYNCFDRDKAEDDALVALAKLTGSAKSPAQYATTRCTLTFDAAAVLESGVHFASLDGDTSVRFTPAADVTASGPGTLTNVVWRAEIAGPIEATATAGHLNIIATPVSGWTDITNTTDASGGTPADGNPELRAKMAEDVAATGTTTVDALRDDVLALNTAQADNSDFTPIQSCKVFENTGDSTDANGLPPHSFEVLVYDGASPGADNNAVIAQAIWDGKAQGIQPYGQIEATAIDEDGNEQTVYFTRVTAKSVYLTYALDTDDAPPYVGDPAFKEAIAELCNDEYDAPDLDVIAAKVKAFAFQVSGVTDVTDFRLGLSPAPSGTTNLAMGPRDLARFDTSRITVT